IYVFTLCRLDCLAWGAALALICREPLSIRMRFQSLLRWVARISGPVFLVMVFAGGWRYDDPVTFTVGFSAVALFVAAVLMEAVSGDLSNRLQRICESPFLIFFGKYSYSIYLFHLPIRAAIRDLVFSRLFHASSGGTALFYQL